MVPRYNLSVWSVKLVRSASCLQLYRYPSTNWDPQNSFVRARASSFHADVVLSSHFDEAELEIQHET